MRNVHVESALFEVETVVLEAFFENSAFYEEVIERVLLIALGVNVEVVRLLVELLRVFLQERLLMILNVDLLYLSFFLFFFLILL